MALAQACQGMLASPVLQNVVFYLFLELNKADKSSQKLMYYITLLQSDHVIAVVIVIAIAFLTYILIFRC